MISVIAKHKEHWNIEYPIDVTLVTELGAKVDLRGSHSVLNQHQTKQRLDASANQKVRFGPNGELAKSAVTMGDKRVATLTFLAMSSSDT